MTYASLCNKTYENPYGLPTVPQPTVTRLLRHLVAINLFVFFSGLLSAQFAPLTISPSSLPYGALGSAYNAQLTANGSGAYTWSISSGSLPPGLTLGSSSGTISGTSTTGGSYTFTVMVLDRRSLQTATQTYTVGILYITNSSPLPNGTTSSAYSVTFNAANGPAGNYSWAIDTTPPGLQLNSNVLSGTPTSAGTFNFNITLTVSSPPGNLSFPTLTTAKAFALTIQAPALVISPQSLPFGALGSVYSAQLRANGSGSYLWSVTQGTLPPGLSLGGSSGTISGTASSGGTYAFTVTLADQKTQQNATAQFTIGILNISTASPLPSGTAMTPYSVSFNASDGPPGAQVWSIDKAPPGLQLNTNVLIGDPTLSGTFNFNISVTVGGLSASKPFALTIASTLMITDASPLPPGDVNVPYRYSFNAVGGPAPFFWTLAGGAAPPGVLAFDTSYPGGLKGTPTSTGTSTFTAQVEDNAQNIVTKAFTLTINPALSISTTSLPAGRTGASYSQTVTATGGTPPYTFSVANAPPGLTIDPKTGVLSGTPTTAQTYPVMVTVSDSTRDGSTGLPPSTSKTFQLTIGSSTAQIIVAPASLSFNGAVGGDSPPAQVIVALPVGVTTAALQVVVDNGQDGSAPPAWLTVTPTGGNTPTRLVVRVDQGSMAAGNYSGRVRVLDSSNNPTDVPVTLALTSAAPQLDAAPRILHVAARVQEPGTQDQIIVVRNIGGGGAVSFNAAVLGGSPWITSVTPNSGQTGHNAPVLVHVIVNTQGLQVGSYRDVIEFSWAGNSVDVPVSLFVASPGSILGVDITGVTIRSQPGGGVSHTPTIRVLNLGDPGTVVNWTADVPTGGAFVSVTPASGTATPGNPGVLTLTPNPGASLATGGNYALVRLLAPGSLNAPQYVIVVIDQENSASAPPDSTTGGLFFTAAAGGSPPPAQQVGINASGTSPFQAATWTSNGGNWLNASPAAGNAGPIGVSVTTGLTPGIYTGEVDISISGVVATVGVTLVVRPAGTIEAFAVEPQATGCTATKIAMTQTGVVNNFSLPAQWPAALVVQLNDDCGAALTNGSVVASFSNGDPPLSLRGDGQSSTYSASWQAGTVTPQMVVTLQAAAGALQPATAQLIGAVSQNQAPVLAKDGTLHNSNPVVGGALAPGTIAQVFGTGLAGATVLPGVVPLPQTFNGTLMLIGGISAPLYYLSSGQLDVQIPNELAPTQQYATVVSANGAFTLPDQIDVVPAVPGVAAFPGGGIIAQHGLDFTLVDAGHPAKPSEYLIMYLAGMGATNPSVASGTASPQASVTVQPTVTVDGQMSAVVYAGLTPGLVGLYQINFQVPASAKTGNLAVVVTQNGYAANTTTLPVSQ